MAVCEVCFRHCDIPEGGLGFCGARTCRDGAVTAANYGRVTALALDPIEKKPLARFYPGSMILSVGSYGCNLRCLFCQNHEISWSKEAFRFAETADTVTPEELADAAERYRDRGNIGLAFTYNEPLIGWEFVRDTARLVHERGMKNVMVTNGTAVRIGDESQGRECSVRLSSPHLRSQHSISDPLSASHCRISSATHFPVCG